MEKQSLFNRLTPFLPHKLKMELAGEVLELTGLDFEEAGALYTGERTWTFRHPDRLPLTPIMRPWSSLAKEITLPNGTKEVPAIEIAKLAYGLEAKWVIRTVGNYEISVATTDGLNLVDINNQLEVFPYKNNIEEIGWDAVHPDNQLAIIRYLESRHFALGFEEGEYIEKLD